ncbi:MAG: phage tail tube protein, partial [Vicinamibacterales bacterium]
MSGFSGFGVRFQRGDGAVPEIFATIAEATNISGPTLDRATLDVTSHDSANRTREYVGGLIDPGEVTFEVNWDPAEHMPLKTDIEQDALPRSYRIVLPNPPSGMWSFKAFVT